MTDNDTSTAIAQSPGTIRKSMGRIVKGEENKTKADMASQIRDDDNIFIIDPSLYDGLCIDHTTTFLTEEGDVEASGIYLGSTENGKPEGYGAFYHRREGKEESIEYTLDGTLVYNGEYKDGEYYNGTIYDENGNVKSVVKDGVIYDE